MYSQAIGMKFFVTLVLTTVFIAACSDEPVVPASTPLATLTVQRIADDYDTTVTKEIFESNNVEGNFDNANAYIDTTLGYVVIAARLDHFIYTASIRLPDVSTGRRDFNEESVTHVSLSESVPFSAGLQYFWSSGSIVIDNWEPDGKGAVGSFHAEFEAPHELYKVQGTFRIPVITPKDID